MSVEYKAWPYKEAQNILDKLNREQVQGKKRKHDFILLQTGFGPSGLPHIGTFSEVARTSFVKQALQDLNPDLDVQIYSFSDDMDGMRGIPLDMPIDTLAKHLGKPLSDVPDPYGEADSFAGHMNKKLCAFLDSFGFDYTFKSSKDQYRGGVFNSGLERIIECYDAVRERVTQTLGDEHKETWSPFLPICEHCGKINTTRVTAVHPEDYTVSYACDKSFNAKILSWEPRPRAKEKKGVKPFYEERRKVSGCGHQGRMTVRDGHVKVGWKVDWALRWYVLGVDYEMYGKDLIDSAVVSSDLVRILGAEPPVGLAYEWFNDAMNQSISKTKGNGVTVEQWLSYAPLESLSWFIYQNPSKSKKIFFGMIPQTVDRFLKDRTRYGQESLEERVNNPIHFVEQARIAKFKEVRYDSDVTYSLVLNLVGVLNTEDPEIVWDYLERYDDQARSTHRAMVQSMIETAIQYNKYFIASTKTYEIPPQKFLPAVDHLRTFLEGYEGQDPEEIQTAVQDARKAFDLDSKQWFKILYKLLLGQERGPRLGSFVTLYGVKNTVALLHERLCA